MENESAQPRSSGTLILGAITCLILSGGFAIMIYAIAKSDSACGSCSEFQIFAVSAGVASAALVVGGLLGFLFSIPRSGAQDNNDPYPDNSNLVEISDWLTKVLVGASLVTLTKIPPQLRLLADWIGQNGYGDQKDGSVFALTLLIFYAVCGFLWMYVWTRLHFANALKASRSQSTLLDIQKTTADTLAAVNESLAELKRTAAAAKESPVAALLLQALSLPPPPAGTDAESVALRNQAKFMGRSELSEHPESRKIAIQYSRLLDEQFKERDEAIRVLKGTLLARRKKGISFDDDDVALNFNIACYLNRKAREENNQNTQETLRLEAINMLREAIQRDANIKAEAKSDADLADLTF
jgi:hypothetical protein